VRQALAVAIDRVAIVENLLSNNPRAATGLVPPTSRWPLVQKLIPVGKTEAKRLFAEGLNELAMDVGDLPLITITYGNSEPRHLMAQAIQQNWREVLGLEVALERQEPKVLWDRLAALDYQICAGSWFADIQDPVDFLNVFKNRGVSTNNTGWEDPVYEGLVEMSEDELDPKERLEVLQLAENLLLEEMPILPIFHYTLNYVKSDKVDGVVLTELGAMDCRRASMKEQR
jgi:oligopeptide transport system substrate-binding protein